MFPLFIAKKIYHSVSKSGKVSSLATKISVAGITLGITIILLSFAIILGFKGEIKHKIYGFCSDIRITGLDYSTSYETLPLQFSDSALQALRNVGGISHLQRYSTKPGMIKTADNFEGVVLKGVGGEYDFGFLKSSMLEGNIPDYSDKDSGNDVLISGTISQRMGIKNGDDIYVYFIGSTIQARKLHVSGIYQTNISNYDNAFIIASIDMVNRLNRWDDSMVSGIEISLGGQTLTEESLDSIYRIADSLNSDTPVTVQTPEDLHPDIFSWLDILDMNVVVILILMFGLSFFTIISGLLIIILERVGMIGTLKALGADNGMIKNIFLSISSMIVIKGLVIGNVIALALYFIQAGTHFLKLDASVYYIDYVPMYLPFHYIIILNLVTLFFSFLVLMLPALIISRISPTKTIKYN